MWKPLKSGHTKLPFVAYFDTMTQTNFSLVSSILFVQKRNRGKMSQAGYKRQFCVARLGEAWLAHGPYLVSLLWRHCVFLSDTASISEKLNKTEFSNPAATKGFPIKLIYSFIRYFNLFRCQNKINVFHYQMQHPLQNTTIKWFIDSILRCSIRGEAE